MKHLLIGIVFMSLSSCAPEHNPIAVFTTPSTQPFAEASTNPSILPTKDEEKPLESNPSKSDEVVYEERADGSIQIPIEALPSPLPSSNVIEVCIKGTLWECGWDGQCEPSYCD